MDNLINTAMSGLHLSASSTDVVPDASGIAMQWQQQLMTPALATIGVSALTTEQNANHAALDTSLLLSLQQVATQHTAAIADTAAVNLQAETGMPELPLTTTDASLAFGSQINGLVVQANVATDIAGKTTLTESRLLGWGNAGQGVLSYMSAYTSASGNTTGQPHLLVSTANAAASNRAQHISVTQPDAALQSLMPGNHSSAASASTRQLAQQHKDTTNAAQHNQKAWSGYDITPQALFFVLSGQQGYRATVRDYFNKEDTLKRLNQIQQEGTFAFGDVQEIWLNGKPLRQQHDKESGYAG